MSFQGALKLLTRPVACVLNCRCRTGSHWGRAHVHAKIEAKLHSISEFLEGYPQLKSSHDKKPGISSCGDPLLARRRCESTTMKAAQWSGLFGLILTNSSTLCSRSNFQVAEKYGSVQEQMSRPRIGGTHKFVTW